MMLIRSGIKNVPILAKNDQPQSFLVKSNESLQKCGFMKNLHLKIEI